MRRVVIDENKLKERYLEGISSNDLAVEFGIGATTVKRHLKNNGVEIRNSSEAKIAYARLRVDQNKIRELYEKGYSLSRVAEANNLAVPTVKRHLQEMGIRVRSKGEAISLEIKSGRMKPPWKSGEENGNWKGGRMKHPSGYIYRYSPGHPRAMGNHVLEHIYEWEKANGKLPEGWVIHHINGIRSDNRLENLKAMPNLKHCNIEKAHQQRIRELELEVEALKILLEDSIECSS